MINSKIRIEPRVIQHLGQDLITSPEVAVTELLKNAIDARAKDINIHIFDNLKNVFKSTRFLRELPKNLSDNLPAKLVDEPFCVVEDNGIGMSPETLESGFLSVGTENKIYQNNTLGEKGIGRLSTQRLGKTVLVETVSNGTLSFLLLDWGEIIAGKHEVVINDFKTIQENYTRIWIFGINTSDFFETDDQITLNLDNLIAVNRNLKTAISFLISPFNHYNKYSQAEHTISMYYDNEKLESHFNMDLLICAESKHYFRIPKNGEGAELEIQYGLDLQPWYIERMHKVLSGNPQAFAVLRQKHSYYAEFIKKYEGRINSALHHKLTENELVGVIIHVLERQYKKRELTTAIEDAIAYKARTYVKYIKQILPVESQIYTFKQNVEVGEKIILESIREMFDKKELNLEDLKDFLSDGNGVKLYRDIFRIGFLGNKENDWIKLQQYRTKGQQFYRFDLGNTLGYVSINDPNQEIVREISSRLDLIETPETSAFKLIINIIFNQVFYDLNRTANALVKALLQEEGLLNDDVSKKIKKNSTDLRELVKKTEEIKKAALTIEQSLQEHQVSEDGSKIIFPTKVFESTLAAVSKVNQYFNQSLVVQSEAVQAIDEVQERLNRVNADLYNNYKLMANGMITEAITHELDSVSKTSVLPNASTHFDELKDFVLLNNGISVYNQDLKPLRDSYLLISQKLAHVADLYNFLEATFIHKGSYDVFENEVISETVKQVEENLALKLLASKIKIHCLTGDLSWILPRGVLLHVLYNLFTNSVYWINKRKIWAKADSHYANTGDDIISIERAGDYSIVVSDTGTGVISSMEDVLFDALQSGKEYTDRRGMGLYIVRQLLKSFGADIELLPERNMYGNRYKFMITYR